MAMHPQTHHDPLADPSHHDKPAHAAMWIAFSALLLLFYESGCGKIFRHLLPQEGAMTAFVTYGSAFFFLLAGPAIWPRHTEGILATGHRALAWILFLLGPYLFGIALISRIEPVEWERVMAASSLLAVYVLFAYLLSQALPEIYFLVQVLLALGGPLLAFFLKELALARSLSPPSYPALTLPSIFFALFSALQEAEEKKMPAWILSGGLFLLGVFVLSLVLWKRGAPHPQSSKGFSPG